jgi:hypothetical protein
MHLVWHGTQEKYQIFDTLGGRFNSEFGMEAFPHIDTIKYYCTDPSQLYPQSHMLDFHNKADGHERRIATYLVENFRTKTNLEVCAVSTVTRSMVENHDLAGRNIAYRTLLTANSHSFTSHNFRRPRH